MINYNNTGYKPPKTSSILIETGAAYPQSFRTDISAMPVLMQAHQPDCVENFVVWAKMFNDFKKTGTVPDLSPRFLFDISYPSPTNNQNGTSLEKACLLAKEVGICENKYWPNTTTLPNDQFADNTQIPVTAFQNSVTHKINDYKVIDGQIITLNMLRSAIARYGFVGAGLKLDQNWWVPSWPKDDKTPIKPPNLINPVSGHCIALIGYDENNFYGINWWSTQFGNKGMFAIGLNYTGFIYEMAVVV